MASEPKTRPTDADVGAHIAAVEPAQRRADAEDAARMLQEITGEQPVMWGPSIVGFGRYTGPTGDWPIVGFAARKAETVFYVMPGFAERADLTQRLGKHRTGGSCLYIRKLSDVDEVALRELLTWSVDTMRERYPG